jgi:xanthine dehydrogenase molybdenum-binding subunit
MKLTVNGQDLAVERPHPHLLAALREELDVLSPKDGCSPTGQCGCCTVLLDGKAVVSCQISLERAEGRSIMTLEGFAEKDRTRLADAFAATGALQCGFCTPGILVRTQALLDRKGEGLTRAEAARHLGAHLCRCTGYTKILDAVEMLAREQPVVVRRPAKAGLGARQLKYEARELALGDRGFVDDRRLPGLLHAALVLSDHARADITAIRTGPAREAPGVVAVLTARDVPGELRVGLVHQDWPVLIPVGGRTSYTGDVLAVVVAETREQARAAQGLVEVDYEPLTPLTDPHAAIDDPEVAVWGTEGNVLSVSAYQRGPDALAAWAASAHRVHEVFETQRVEHAFLEPESTLVLPRSDGRLHVWSGGQGVWDDRDQIAAVLGIAPSRVTVEMVSNGGAFGGKEDLSNQAHTALAAFVTRRPVKCTLSREESLRLHPKRHPMRLEYKAACDGDGRLSALWARIVGDSGSYASVGMKVLERAAGHAGGPYRVPAIDVEAVAVRTNNPPGGAFRGFGADQAQFAMEGVIDRLAEAAGLTGWEMRARNVIRPGDEWGPGQLMDDGCLGAAVCLDAVRPMYDAARAAGKAVGLGLGLKSSGLGNGFREIARATVRFKANGGVEVRHCWTEMGQGVHTVALQVAVEELGVDPDKVVVLVDTSRELGAGQTTGSRSTLMVAGSVADACRKGRADGRRLNVDYPGEYRVDWTNKLTDGVEHPVIHSAFGYAAQVVIVDRASGRVERVVAAHDVGRAVNPLMCEGQIEGSVHMGLGHALTEDFPTDERGRPRNMTLRSLGIIRPKDMPPVDVILVECPQPGSPYGVKGVGEIGLVPTAGAVAAALHDRDGAWRARLPMRPD